MLGSRVWSWSYYWPGWVRLQSPCRLRHGHQHGWVKPSRRWAPRCEGGQAVWHGHELGHGQGEVGHGYGMGHGVACGVVLLLLVLEAEHG